MNTARVQVTPQISLEPSFSVNVLDLPRQSVPLTVVRNRAFVVKINRLFLR